MPPRPSSPPGPLHGELADRTFVRLRDLIVRGRMRPGARLNESELAAQFDVSRTPVRESLARLAQEGYVVPSNTGRRVELVVAPLSRDAVEELWTLIGGLEGLAVLRAATLGRDTRRQLAAALARLNDDLYAAARTRPRDIDRVSELMTSFHTCFMDACAGPALRAVYDRVRPHVMRYEWAYGMHRGARYEASIREHRGIIDAVAAGDGPRGRRLVERHWANGVLRTQQLAVASAGIRALREKE